MAGLGWEVVFAGFILGVLLLSCTSPTPGPKVAPYMFETLKVSTVILKPQKIGKST